MFLAVPGTANIDSDLVVRKRVSGCYSGSSGQKLYTASGN